MLILPSPDHTFHDRLVPVPPRHRVVVPQKSDVAITIRCPVEMCATLCAVHHSRDSDPSVCLHLFFSDVPLLQLRRGDRCWKSDMLSAARPDRLPQHSSPNHTPCTSHNKHNQT